MSNPEQHERDLNDSVRYGPCGGPFRRSKPRMSAHQKRYLGFVRQHPGCTFTNIKDNCISATSVVKLGMKKSPSAQLKLEESIYGTIENGVEALVRRGFLKKQQDDLGTFFYTVIEGVPQPPGAPTPTEKELERLRTNLKAEYDAHYSYGLVMDIEAVDRTLTILRKLRRLGAARSI